jgi:hypothetical protein
MSSSYHDGGGEPYNEGTASRGGAFPGVGEHDDPSGAHQTGTSQPYETSQFPVGGPQGYQGGQPGYQQYSQQPGYPQHPGQQGHQGGSGGLQGLFHGGPLSSSGNRRSVRSSFKTTEFWAYIIAVIALLIAAAVTDQGSDNQGFGAHDAWKYVTWLTIGYMVSRGLTKFGGHERDSDHDHGDR